MRTYLDRIGYLHLKDVKCNKFVPVGRGEIDFKALFSILKEGGFDGWAVVENEVKLEEEMTPEEWRQYQPLILKRCFAAVGAVEQFALYKDQQFSIKYFTVPIICKEE